MTIQQLVENKSTLDYQKLCTELIQIFTVNETVNWESVLPAQQQQEYFGGETLRLIAEHPILSKQKDIRPIALKKGSISQMLFFYVCLNDDSLSKKNIQDVTKKFISGGDASRYIIWFFGNTKNSELKVVLSAKEGKKIVLKTLPFATNQPYFKTYNYILNEVSKNVNKLFVEPTELWKALWKAFDISIVNRNFYNEIKEVFDSLINDELKTSTKLFKKEEIKVQFAIRLIGRIIFCWFLKRKGIINDEVLSSEAVKKHKGYYHNLLSVLFFDVFNTPEKERKGGIPKIISKYPFLNGGLFEAQETDFKDNLILSIDNEWFYNLFSKTLERYNFTVDENSSSNAEIAIDPEMLGRIFENLLAEQNPETGDSARKATGSFYTPREIVDYMVEQSLSEYLKTTLLEENVQESPLKENLFGVVPSQQLELPKSTNGSLPNSWETMIEDFVHTQTLPASLQKYESQISSALVKIKVLDPACGSGAFPIGVLQKIVALKQQLHPKTKNYNLKLDTIQNSIYGVDIQPMAVELSRLRCWLSLVVDEEPNDIKALPNLDFKFICADTLVDVPENNYVKIQSAESLSKFATATSQYFNPDHKKKKELKEIITKCLLDITKTHDVVIKSIIDQTRKEKNSATPKRLKQLEKELLNYSHQQSVWHTYANIFENKKVDFFNTQYFFPLAKDGFDIIIGNPPYGHTIKDNTDYYTENFKSAEGKHEIFKYFIEKGLTLLKKNGILTYITSDTWTSLGYFKKLRQIIYEHYNLKAISKTLHNVFETAMVDTNVYFIQNSPPSSGSKYQLIDGDLKTKTETFFEIDSDYVFNLKEKNPIIKQIEGTTNRLDEYTEIWQGLIAYGKKDQPREYSSDKKETKLHRKLLYGGDIAKYKIKWSGEYLKYGEWLHRPRPSYIFDKEKILVQRIRNPKLKVRLVCALDNNQFINGTGLSNILLKEKVKNISLRYLLSILNSKAINYWFNYYYIDVNIKPEQLRKVPIPAMNNKGILETLVSFVLLINETDNDNSINESVSNKLILKHFEDIIDGIVFELFFENHMKEKDIDIISLVEKELQKLKNSQDSSDIYKFYLSVSHPDNPIRNRILNFPLASPTILKTILQG